MTRLRGVIERDGSISIPGICLDTALFGLTPKRRWIPKTRKSSTGEVGTACLGKDKIDMDSSYELQISSEARRKGLARILMRRLERIGAERKMQKAMLTCLKGRSVSIRLCGDS